MLNCDPAKVQAGFFDKWHMSADSRCAINVQFKVSETKGNSAAAFTCSIAGERFKRFIIWCQLLTSQKLLPGRSLSGTVVFAGLLLISNTISPPSMMSSCLI